MSMMAWYKSWFRTSGTLDLPGYILHIVAAFAFFAGFAFLGMIPFWLAMGPLIVLHMSAWAAWLPMLVYLPFMLLAVGSWAGIVIASTMRFVRRLVSGGIGDAE
jgi:hypothetical protein